MNDTRRIEQPPAAPIWRHRFPNCGQIAPCPAFYGEVWNPEEPARLPRRPLCQ